MLRFLYTGDNDGATNMAIDEALACCFKGDLLATVRFYGWQRPSVSIGYFQKMEEIKTQIHANPTQIYTDFVRRPTGGGAVIHNGNTTFSVIFRNEDKHIEYYYRTISEAITNSISDTAKPQNPAKPQKFCVLADILRFSGVNGIFCHNNITKYDVVVDGTKVAGFAAKRFRNTILLQAYIDVGYNDFLQSALSNSFEKVLGFKGFIDELTQQERQHSLDLRSKYRSKGWNYKR